MASAIRSTERRVRLRSPRPRPPILVRWTPDEVRGGLLAQASLLPVMPKVAADGAIKIAFHDLQDVVALLLAGRAGTCPGSEQTSVRLRTEVVTNSIGSGGRI